MGSPEIRHVPVERILSEAVYARIKNKENRLYQTTAGKIILIHFGFLAIHISKAIAD